MLENKDSKNNELENNELENNELENNEAIDNKSKNKKSKNTRVKVLVFGITDNPGGVESVIMNYYRALDRTKIQFDFLCNTQVVAYEDEIRALGGQIYRVTMRSANRQQYRKDMDEFYRQHAAEYAAIWVNVCSLANIDYLIYARRYGIPCRIIHSHNSQNMDSRLRGILHHMNKMRIAKFATDFWACSEDAGLWFYGDAIRSGQRYRLVHNAIDLAKYKFDEQKRRGMRSQLGLEDKFVIGNVGRLHFQKNQTFLLDIFHDVLKSKPDSRLLLIGQGEDEEMLRTKISDLGMEEQVQMLGVRSDVNDLFQAMDVFVLPSVFEGLGLVLIEAQANSLPCFASKDVIPQEANMSEAFTFIPLSLSPAEWAEQILARDYDRAADYTKTITGAGYNMATEIEAFERFFISVAGVNPH